MLRIWQGLYNLHIPFIFIPTYLHSYGAGLPRVWRVFDDLMAGGRGWLLEASPSVQDEKKSHKALAVKERYIIAIIWRFITRASWGLEFANMAHHCSCLVVHDGTNSS